MNYLKEFNTNGFFIKKKFFKKNIIKRIIFEIFANKKSTKYFDNSNKLRRIERLYNGGPGLRKINSILLYFLKKIFYCEYQIFKDKFNAKPPGGEGFSAHYDGIFNFKDKNNIIKNGWYEYSNNFINILIALDPCNKMNGTIEIAKIHNDSFNNLLKNTYQNGTPLIRSEIEKKIKFKKIFLEPGDIVVFSNLCPHRSKKNISKKERKTLYYTYTSNSKNNIYKKYFIDKKYSKNKTDKSLSGAT